MRTIIKERHNDQKRDVGVQLLKFLKERGSDEVKISKKMKI
jgi:hypothetical protein